MIAPTNSFTDLIHVEIGVQNSYEVLRLLQVGGLRPGGGSHDRPGRPTGGAESIFYVLFTIYKVVKTKVQGRQRQWNHRL